MHQAVDLTPSTQSLPERNRILEGAGQRRFNQILHESAQGVDGAAPFAVALRPFYSAGFAATPVRNLQELQGFPVGVEFNPDTGTYSLRHSAAQSDRYTFATSSSDGARWVGNELYNDLDWIPRGVAPGTCLRLGIKRASGVETFSYVILPDPRVPGWNVETPFRDEWSENAGLINALTGLDRVVVGLNPPIGGPGYHVGSVATEASHVALNLEDGRIRVTDVGTKNGFFLERVMFKGAVVEYFPPSASTVVLPGDKLWLGSSPALGLDCDLKIPSFSNASRNVPRAEIGCCMTESSACAFLLRGLLKEPTIRISQHFKRDQRINLVGSHIQIHGEIIRQNPALGIYTFHFIQEPGMRVQVSGALRAEPLLVYRGSLTLLPGDRISAQATIGSQDGMRPYVILPESDRYDEVLATQREAEAKHATAKTEWIAAFSDRLNRLFGQMQNGEIPLFTVHRKLEPGRNDPTGIEFEGLTLTTVARVTFAADENGTCIVSSRVPTKFTGLTLKLRNADGTMSPQISLDRNEPVRLAPGDVVVFPTSDFDKVEYTIPPNDRFRAQLELRQVFPKQSQVIASFVGSIGSMASVINPGNAPVDKYYLRHNGFYPVSKVEQPEHGLAMHLSRPFVMDSGGRIGVVAVVRVGSQQSVRVFYTSISHAIFRLLPAVNTSGLIYLPGYDKGGNEQALAPSFHIQKALWQHVAKCFAGSHTGPDSTWRDLRESPDVWQGVVRLNGNFDEYSAYQDNVEANPALASKALPILTGKKLDVVSSFSSLALHPDHKPNFRQRIDFFEVPKLPFGPTAAYKGPVRFLNYYNGTRTDEHVVAVTPMGYFMPMIAPSPSSPGFALSPFGIPSTYYEADALVMPLLERPMQIPDGEFGLTDKVDDLPQYRNVMRLLALRHPLLRDWIIESPDAAFARQ